jgi:hypothetical protein
MVKLANQVGMQCTLITCDQTINEIAYAIRQQPPDTIDTVNLILRGFPLCHNVTKGVTKLMRGSGCEEIIVAAGVCLPGTVKKVLGDKCDYYQTMSALLYELLQSWLNSKS